MIDDSNMYGHLIKGSVIKH